MAQAKTEVRAAYPLPAYNYRVSVAGETLRFSEVSGLKQEYEAVEYRHGLSHWTGPRILPGMPKTVTITLKRGIVPKGGVLQDWLAKTYSEPFYGKAKRDLVIDLCDERGVPVVSWTVAEALPTALEAPAFDASSNEVAIETLELRAKRIRIEFHD
jgi:phage tail-like protein